MVMLLANKRFEQILPIGYLLEHFLLAVWFEREHPIGASPFALTYDTR
jgi:hypothetical protein